MKCKACLLTCMDFRLNDHLLEILKAENLTVSDVDIIRVAGGVKPLASPNDQKLLVDSIKISVEAHNAQKVILVNHEDCKAYENVNPEKDAHFQDLNNSKNTLNELFPEVEIHCYYLQLDGTYSKV